MRRTYIPSIFFVSACSLTFFSSPVNKYLSNFISPFHWACKWHNFLPFVLWACGVCIYLSSLLLLYFYVSILNFIPLHLCACMYAVWLSLLSLCDVSRNFLFPALCIISVCLLNCGVTSSLQYVCACGVTSSFHPIEEVTLQCKTRGTTSSFNLLRNLVGPRAECPGSIAKKGPAPPTPFALHLQQLV